MCRAYIVIILFTTIVLRSWGQAEVGIIVGISNYQGDLPSYNTENGFRALVGPVFGVHAGYEISSRFQWRADLLYTRLSGDDALSEKETTRARNLDFFSPILQLAGGIDWNVLGFSPRNGKAFTPYVSAGASLFHMNPKTKYQGETVTLHPLGTEGQYIDDYPDQKPYHLIQPSLQFGGGLKLMTQSRIILALEGMLSYAFTDYIDDASTIYINYNEQVQKSGLLSASVANRQGEYAQTEPVSLPTGTARANPKTDDLFGVITARVGMPLDIGSSGFRIRRGKSKTIDCPKF